ncbi:glycosyltransferase [Parvicella tangerina]|uniref:Glycosyltransferase subfamily 4-like N-terminal domain-containing protein n=1 Tax=Parvicella tangerina TaxID=2829795 RepID=A0A916NG17_9FLAO|nr:glycosyltransferase [Parvicella tangerina]CAG5079757.1 hypothetical protein CRYO30217_01051 [Parvicella tangerina]
MKKVLIIAYHYPPRGGAGVHRNINLVNQIRDYDFEPVVLTITEDEMVKQNERIDRSLLNKVPGDVLVRRTSSGIPFGFKNFLIKIRLFRLAWFFLYPMFWETAARWHKVAYRDAKELITQHKISVVYTSSGPFASMVLARRLQKDLGVKWVADLRDPFTDAYAWKFPSYMHWKWMRRFERKYFSKPDKLIVNTPEVKKLYIKRDLVDSKKITVVTNGY